MQINYLYIYIHLMVLTQFYIAVDDCLDQFGINPFAITFPLNKF